MIFFDSPSVDLRQRPFEERYYFLLSNTVPDHAFAVSVGSQYSFFYSILSYFILLYSFYNILSTLFYCYFNFNFNFNFTKIVVPRVMSENNAHLSSTVQGIIEDGGEGVILRKIGSIYEHGRSPSLLKIKVSI
jgi:hypothetical protein